MKRSFPWLVFCAIALVAITQGSDAYAANILGYECNPNAGFSERVGIFFRGLFLTIGCIVGLFLLARVTMWADKKGYDLPIGLEDSGDLGEGCLIGIGMLICGSIGGIFFALTGTGCDASTPTAPKTIQGTASPRTTEESSTSNEADGQDNQATIAGDWVTEHTENIGSWIADLIDAAKQEWDVPRLDFNIEEPVAIYKAAPKYPSRALNAGKEGVVVVGFSIDRNGFVYNPYIISATPKGWGFEAASIEAILRWRFQPRLLNGAATETVGMEVRMVFELN